MKKNIPTVIMAVLSLTACDSIFDIHPYDMNINGAHDINATNIALIEKTCKDKDTMRVAVISDSHGWYSDTKDEVANINEKGDSIDFVIHCGDLTDTGTTTEYKWIRNILGELHKPYVVLIGNHDFLGTGDQAYNYIYGDMDFSFIANRVKFICLNTNATEYDYIASVPNFDFIYKEGIADSTATDFDRSIVFMHAAPYSDQFNNNVVVAFGFYMENIRGIMFCVYGHDHANGVSTPYNNNLKFYGIDCAEHRNYAIFTITKNGYEYQNITY